MNHNGAVAQLLVNIATSLQLGRRTHSLPRRPGLLRAVGAAMLQSSAFPTVFPSELPLLCRRVVLTLTGIIKSVFTGGPSHSGVESYAREETKVFV